jgi:hypothetical protein
LNQCLIHRGDVVGVSREVLLRRDGLRERLAEDDAAIFHAMVVVNVEIAFALQSEVKVAVKGHELKHVIEKADASGHVLTRASVQVEHDFYACLMGLAKNFGEPDSRGGLAHAMGGYP